MKRDAPPSKLDRTLADVCRNCPVCRTARRKQADLAFWLGNGVEQHLCPFGRAYDACTDARRMNTDQFNRG
jgi:hypothetical protein